MSESLGKKQTLRYDYVRYTGICPKINRTLYALLLSVAVLAGGIGSITDYSYAQTNTEKINAIAENTAEANTILDAIRAALEDLAAALPLLSDDLDRFESRISDLESKLDGLITGLNTNQTSDDNESSPAILESIEEVNAQLADLQADLQADAGQFSGGSGPMQGMNGDDAPNPPVLSYARAEVVFDTIATEKAGDNIDL